MPIVGTLPFNIQAGQLVSAAPVMGNYNFIHDQVNANAVPNVGPATLTGAYTITGTLSISSTLSVAGASTLTGNVTIGAPASGVALTVTGFAGSDVADFAATNNAGAVGITLSNNGTGAASSSLTINTPNGTGNASTVLASNSGTGYVGTNNNTPLSVLTNNSVRIAVAAAGNITINAPTSGTALVVNGFSSSDIADFSGTFNGNIFSNFNNTSAGASATMNLQVGCGSTVIAVVQANLAGNVVQVGSSSNHQLNIISNGATRIFANTSGNVTVNAPTSGVALTVNGFAGSDVADFVLSTNGTVAVTVSNQNAGASAIAEINITSNSGGVVLINRSTAAGAFSQLADTSGTLYLSSTALNLQTSSLNRIQVVAAGNVTINAPTSGDALTVTSATDLTGIQINGTVNNVALTLTNTGTGGVSNWHVSATDTASGFGGGLLVIGQASQKFASWNSSGNLVVYAPSSGVALTVNAAASSNALVVNGAASSIPLSVVPSIGNTVRIDTGRSAITSASTISNTETYFTAAFEIGASTLAAGDSFRVVVQFTYTTTSTTDNFTFKLKLGTAGTTADTTIASSPSVNITATGTNVNGKVEADITFRTVGASGSVIAGGMEQSATGATADVLQNFFTLTSTGSINTTANLFLGMSMVTSSANTTFTIGHAIVERVM